MTSRKPPSTPETPEMPSGDDPLRGAAVRQLRLQQLLHRELEGLLRDDITDPRLADVTITAVELAADCRSARVHVTSPRVVPPAEVTAALDQAASFLRSELAATLDMKFVPTLSFRAITGG